jgi:hypothetical protein
MTMLTKSRRDFLESGVSGQAGPFDAPVPVKFRFNSRR